MEGRVEVCYGKNWGGICSSNYYNWGPKEASAVCRQLGYFPYDAIAFNNSNSSYFGVGPTTYYLSVDYCDYSSEGLLDCFYHTYHYYFSVATLGSYSCINGLKDVAVKCLGELLSKFVMFKNVPIYLIRCESSRWSTKLKPE